MRMQSSAVCFFESFSPAAREAYKHGLATVAAGLGGPLVAVTAMLPPGASRPALEAAFRNWAARIDRAYLGRNWHRKRDLRMDGMVFFETRPGNHIHAIIRPPVGADIGHFIAYGASWFSGLSGGGIGKPVAPRGKMLIQLVGPAPEDLVRATRYAAKEVEFLASAMTGWKFLRDLSVAK